MNIESYTNKFNALLSKYGIYHTESIAAFRDMVYAFYALYERSLPWRQTDDPYCILVSELMLQQTQVERVIPKYKLFTKTFPAFEALAHANLPKVIEIWQGLGYNRRALALHKIARIVTNTYNNCLPETIDELKQLPGIGQVTAAAICAFAYNKPVVYLDTNVQSVYIHHFFQDHDKITDKQLLPIIECTLDKETPRQWYYALLDYGVYLKKSFVNPGRKSAHYQKQSPFMGSNRQKRGAIIKLLLKNAPLTANQIARRLHIKKIAIENILTSLCSEGFLGRNEGKYCILSDHSGDN